MKFIGYTVKNLPSNFIAMILGIVVVFNTNLVAQDVTYADILRRSLPDFGTKDNKKGGASRRDGWPSNESEILKYLFTDPVVDNLLLPEARSLEHLSTYLDSYNIPAEGLERWNDLMMVQDFSMTDSVSKLRFSFQGDTHESYSFFIPGKEKRDTVAFLIIPGSNVNQSTEILRNEESGYHRDIASVASSFGDTYVFIKPNEDLLAFHWGRKKLNTYALHTVLLNKGYSYSAYYLAQVIALAKHLKSTYKRVVILGCSQGGNAAILTSSLIEPDACVVSSGYSIMMDNFNWMGADQFIIPGLNKVLNKEFLYQRMSAQNTRYFLTYGKNDIAFYKVEAEENLTAEFFSRLNNVRFSSGDFGHTFPQPEVHDFIGDFLYPTLTFSQGTDTVFVCPGDSISVPNYKNLEYTWFHNGNALVGENRNTLKIDSPGKYFVTSYSRDMNTRSFSDTVTVVLLKQPPKPSILGDDDIFYCPGDSVHLMAEDTGLEFLWSTGDDTRELAVDEPGEFFVQAVNTEGCKSNPSESVFVRYFDVRKPELTYDTSFLCRNGTGSSVEIRTVEQYMSYYWSTGDSTASVTIEDEGTVFVEVIDSNNCKIQSDSVHIQYFPYFPVIMIQETKLYVEGGEKYQWYYNGQVITGEDLDYHYASEPGYYHVAVSYDDNVCQISSEPVYFDPSKANTLIKIEDQNSIKAQVFNDELGPIEIELINMSGQIIKKETHFKDVQNFEVNLDLSNISGAFIIRIKSKSGVFTEKFIKL